MQCSKFPTTISSRPPLKMINGLRWSWDAFMVASSRDTASWVVRRNFKWLPDPLGSRSLRMAKLRWIKLNRERSHFNEELIARRRRRRSSPRKERHFHSVYSCTDYITIGTLLVSSKEFTIVAMCLCKSLYYCCIYIFDELALRYVPTQWKQSRETTRAHLRGCKSRGLKVAQVKGTKVKKTNEIRLNTGCSSDQVQEKRSPRLFRCSVKTHRRTLI